MFRMTTLLTAPAFVMLMGGTAHAALTADQVWQSWKDAAALAGLTVSAATEVKDGSALKLNGVAIAPAGVASGVTISDMSLTEEADGSVTIRPGADIAVNMAGEGSGGSVKVTHDGLEMKAREGEGGALIYDYSAAALNLLLDVTYPGSPSPDGSAPQPGAAKGTFGFTDLSGSYSDTPGTNRAFGFDLKAAKLGYDFGTEDPGLEMKTTSVSNTSDVEISLDVALPSTMSLFAMASPADFSTALEEGLSISMATKQGESIGSASQEQQFFSYNMDIKGGAGQATGVFNKDEFRLDSGGAGLEFNMVSPSLPVPINVTSGPFATAMIVPMSAGDAASDYGLVFKLSQFTLNEEAWALFDPQGALTRGPADLSIDVSGKSKLDVLGMMAAEGTGAPPPIPQPETLNINDLTLKIAGAALTGTGAFTFDNSAGVPMPLGEANVSLTGGNALIDGLIATGMVTEEDAMGARMMMGAFMSPGAEPDSLTSKIEAKAGGEIYVNGQRVQ
ncbi:MAG: DUF2125 domain-containing protein [Tabrizicola sp.]|nr:DUF2125 domain-containing protein [Tabrizicola sp.]